MQFVFISLSSNPTGTLEIIQKHAIWADMFPLLFNLQFTNTACTGTRKGHKATYVVERLNISEICIPARTSYHTSKNIHCQCIENKNIFIIQILF